ncbi:MAG TPA: right-handed parallel beta-helix repeat-containing protein [Bryobacteraceae bacterium]|nr:right-handed parallel beta-helix repeat-containing protein [Bryobacteraceae bacterium]
MIALRLALLAFAAIAANGATYHVDSASGKDVNSGLSPRAAWQSLQKINSSRFQPGDRILFKRGGVWNGGLSPASSGATGAPIVIDAYGAGAYPRIDAGGMAEDALRLYNVEWIEVRNLELTNRGDQPARRRGVHIFLDNFGTAHHVVVSGLYIHDVNGANKIKDNGGIIFRTNGNKTPSRFDGLLIERNIIWRVDRSAIAAQSYHWQRDRWHPSLNVVIRDNFASDIGGDGIVPWATDGALIEHNTVRDANRRAETYNAGIWPWSTDNSVFRWNDAGFVRTTLDGQGFDSDFNSRNTLFEYNYSHDNEGGFMLICTPGKRNAAQNIGNIGTVVRHNISRNDRARIFHVSAAEKTLVHDNVIYVGPDLEVQMLLLSDWSGWPDGAVFRNNTFYSAGTSRYGHESARSKDGTYTIAPGFGPARGVAFEGNRFYGRHIDPPADPKGIVDPAVPTPKADWNAPEFDPSSPANFDAYLKRHRQWMQNLFDGHFPSKAAQPRTK